MAVSASFIFDVKNIQFRTHSLSVSRTSNLRHMHFLSCSSIWHIELICIILLILNFSINSKCTTLDLVYVLKRQNYSLCKQKYCGFVALVSMSMIKFCCYIIDVFIVYLCIYAHKIESKSNYFPTYIAACFFCFSFDKC